MIKMLLFTIVTMLSSYTLYHIYKLYNMEIDQMIAFNNKKEIDPDFIGFLCVTIDGTTHLFDYKMVTSLYYIDDKYIINDVSCDEFKELEYSKL